MSNMVRKLFIFNILVLYHLSYSSVSANNDDGTIVQTDSGLINGKILKSENGNDYWSFQEIPYAAPPVGENRFQAPKPPTPWPGILSTLENTKICYQNKSRFSNLEISEDCLYINVYTPVKPGSQNSLPVLLWIHGGGFVAESGVYGYYGPKYIMDHGVVVVSFNYRLGALGFLGTDDGVIPAQLGLKDQVFAMKWVNRNINKFGGSNEHVVIVGESAGSAAVGDHLIGPWEDNVLFHGAIMQSGSPVGGGTLKTNGTEVAIDLVKAIDPNFSPTTTTEILKFLQQADAKDILNSGITGLNVRVPGSVGGFQSFLDKNYKNVPVLIGFNSEEFLFEQFVNKTTLEQVDKDPSVLISKGVNMSPQNRTVAGMLYKQVYTKGKNFVDDPGSYVRSISDSAFTTATCKQVELGSVNVPYYFYQFSYKGELGGQTQITPLEDTGSVVHAEDLHYMWEETGYNSDLNKFPEADQLTLHRFVKMWTNFVKYFNPTPEVDPILGSVKWLESEPKTLIYLNINETLEMRENPRQYRQLKPILETYMEPPFNAFN